jgi:hypothetical protein
MREEHDACGIVRDFQRPFQFGRVGLKSHETGSLPLTRGLG